MDLRIRGKNLELNDETRTYVERKINRLGRHLPGISTVVVELAHANARSQDSRVVAQITLDVKGDVLRAEERGANAMAAVDSVIDVMDRRVERYKSKVYRSKQARRAARRDATKAGDLDLSDEEPSGDVAIEEEKVVRVKRFPIKPMAVDEAVFQMELLGHDFFLFLDSDSNGPQLLYRRKDGQYGLIQPEPM